MAKNGVSVIIFPSTLGVSIDFN